MNELFKLASELMTGRNGIILISLLASFAPVGLWLWFWLHEDKKKPEPKRMIFKTFIVSGFFITIAFCLERLITPDTATIARLQNIFHQSFSPALFLAGLWPLLAWAFIEEVVKYAAAYAAALKSPDNDEPIDAMVYLLTAALGFAAVENFLFLLSIGSSGGALTASFLFTGNLRFLGATLLHVVSSATLGAFIGYSFYKSLKTRMLFTGLGILAAVLLHTLFNLFIIMDDSKNILSVFISLWLAAVGVMILFEVVRRVKKKKNL